MIVARNEQRHALLARPVTELVTHAETFGDLGDGALERAAVGLKVREVEMHALKKLRRQGVGVLVGIEDIRAMAVQNLRQGGDDAAPIGAGDQQRGALGFARAHRRRL